MKVKHVEVFMTPVCCQTCCTLMESVDSNLDDLPALPPMIPYVENIVSIYIYIYIYKYIYIYIYINIYIYIYVHISVSILAQGTVC